MLVGVISDTHIPFSAPRIPERVFQLFRGVELILHAGDLVDLAVLEDLRKIAPTEAVSGNMDPPEVKNALSVKKIIKVGAHRLGLIHGSGLRGGLAERMRREFSNATVVVFGHSHQPFQEIIDEVLIFNPGTPTDRHFTRVRTVGRLEVGRDVKGEIIYL